MWLMMLAGMVPERSRVTQEPGHMVTGVGFRASGEDCPLEQRGKEGTSPQWEQMEAGLGVVEGA